jgi:type IV fimbrial biogenesis protein FimT
MRLIASPSAAARERGMTLIELMIGITIAAILFLLAAPAYQEFIANTNVRSAAENTLNGLRTANAEAIKRNAPVRFAVVGGGWTVDEVNPADGTVVDPITTYAYTEGAKKATMDSFGGGTTVTFNGLGRVMNPNPGDFPLITDLQFSTDMIDDERKQHIVVGSALSATGIRMCNNNLNLPADDPSRCPDVADHKDRGT